MSEEEEMETAVEVPPGTRDRSVTKSPAAPVHGRVQAPGPQRGRSMCAPRRERGSAEA